MHLSEWHTQQSYIDRTNNIMKTIASMYRDRADVVATIAPLNEYACSFHQFNMQSDEHMQTSWLSRVGCPQRYETSKVSVILNDTAADAGLLVLA